jgi:hypothetical protein
MPHAAAGLRIDPPVSVPSVAGANPAAIAAADPDDEPAGEWSRFHGLSAGGNGTSQDGPPCANSQVAFLPSSMPPAAARFSWQQESRVGTLSASSFDISVVRIPAVS